MCDPATKLDRTPEVADRIFCKNALPELLLDYGDETREPLFGRLGFNPLDCSRDPLADDRRITEFLRLLGGRSGDRLDVPIRPNFPLAKPVSD